MDTNTFSEDYSKLKLNSYLEVYKSQNLNHQDYFHHPEFQYKCFSVFSKFSKCYLLSVFNDRELIGYLGLRTTHLTITKIKYKFLVTVTFGIAEYNYPIIHKKHIDIFLSVLNKVLVKYNVHFQHIPGFFKKRILDVVSDSFVSRVIDNPLIINLDKSYLKDLRSKSGSLRNKKRLIKKYNDFEIRHISDGINQDLLDVFFDMHINRWKADGIESYFNSEEYREIYLKIANLKIDNIGYPLFSFLRADGAYLAMQFSFFRKNRILLQISARTLNKKYKSAGSILTDEILEFMNLNQIEICDMGAGLESYKYNYMNELETYFNITKFKNPISGLFSRIKFK